MSEIGGEKRYGVLTVCPNRLFGNHISCFELFDKVFDGLRLDEVHHKRMVLYVIQ